MVLSALCISAAQVRASDLIISRTVLEDPSGAMTVNDVARRDGTPCGTPLATDSGSSVYWVRLQVRAPAQGSKVVLYILPTYINEIRIYEANPGESGPGNSANWKTRVTGNLYPYAQRDRATTALGFLVNITAPEATYYLRIKGGSAQVSVEAMPLDEAVQKDHRRDLLEVFFLTSMLGLLIWATQAYYLDREPVVGLFAAYQAVYILLGFVMTGYLAPLSSASFPHLANWLTSVLYLLFNVTLLLFCRELFKPYDPPRWAMRLSSLFLWMYPVLFVLVIAGYDDFATTVNALLIRITWVYLVVVVFFLRAESTPKRRTLQVFFVFIWLNNIAFWYINRGSLPISKTDLGMVQILVVDGFLFGGVFTLMLHARIRRKLREGHQSILDLEGVRKKFEIEQELKRQIEIQAQTDDLTGMNNRRHFIELAERELSRAIRFQRPLTLLEIDIDNFKKINDTRGHRTGDTVLQEISGALRQVLRTEDILGRIGGDEFAVVIVEMEGADSIKTAQRLCATAADAIAMPLDNEPLQLGLSIGLTQLQGRSMDFSSLLEEADQALYRAKQAGRNRVFVSTYAAASQQNETPATIPE
ncbi:MAG: diguanylate cyclase [Terracidiphilus sp.]|nr:diguanylate cyclase [Terracidiphilus sp.]